jgi:hypothetical protein
VKLECERVLAGRSGISIGQPSKYGHMLGGRKSLTQRYEASDCPLCHGQLFLAPQCSGRALSDAGPNEPYWKEPIPEANFAVACPACLVAFFPLKIAKG